MSARMRGAQIALLVAALGVVIALLVTSLGHAPLPDLRTDRNAPPQPLPDLEAGTSAAPGVRLAAPHAEGITIVVTDATTGSPIPGVSCSALAEHQLHADPGTAPRIGATDAAGRLHIVDADEEATYLLIHSDYCATFVDREPGVRIYAATMERGVTLTFTAKTRDGNALEGVAIAVAPAGKAARSELEDRITNAAPGVGRNARAVGVTGRDGRATLGPVSPGALTWAVWHGGCTAVSFEPVEWAMHPQSVPRGEVQVMLDPIVGMHFAVSEPVLNWMAKTPKGLHVAGASVRDLELRRQRIMGTDPTRRTVCVLYPVRHDATHGYARLPDKGHISILTEAYGWTDVVADIQPLPNMVEPQFIELGTRPTARPTTRVQIHWQADTKLPAISSERVLLTPVTDDPLEQHRQVLLRPGEQEVVPCGPYSLDAPNPFLANVLRDRRVSIDPATQSLDVAIGELKYVEIVAAGQGIGSTAMGTMRISSGETSRTLTVQGGRVWSLVPTGELQVVADFGRSNGEVRARVDDHGQTIRVPLSPAR